MRHAVAQTVVLAMVNEVVVNMMLFAVHQIDAGMAKTGDIAVVHLQAIVPRRNTVLGRKLVVVLVPIAASSKRSAMMI